MTLRDAAKGFKPGKAAEVLQIYKDLHRHKIFGEHMLWTVVERVAAGESEADVLADYGYVRETVIKPLEWATDPDIDCYESQKVLHGHTYSVWRSIEPGLLPWMAAIGTDTDSETLDRFESSDAGKAACQAHYEAAVMNCLEDEG